MENSPPGNGRRIALAFPSMLPLGGAERVQIDLAREFQALGFDVDIVIADEPQDARPYFKIETRVFTFGTPRIRQFIRPFAAYLRAERPAMVIASMWPFTAACVIAARLAGTRTVIVVSEHNVLSAQYMHAGNLHRVLMRASIAVFYRWAAARVAVSSGVAVDLVRLGWLRPESVRVIYNPVKASATAIRPEYLTDVGKAWQGCAGARLLAVGRLKSQKNYPLLLQALALLLPRREVHLVIVGTGPDKDAIGRLIAASGLNDHVTLAGHVEDPTPYYHCADLLVLSSDYEGFGNVIVEAMSCGTPVVSTDCPSGPAEILENEAWGRLAPVGDANALARAIAAELDNPHRPEDLIRRATAFTPSIAARQYLALHLPEFAPHPSMDAQSPGAAQ